MLSGASLHSMTNYDAHIAARLAGAQPWALQSLSAEYSCFLACSNRYQHLMALTSTSTGAPLAAVSPASSHCLEQQFLLTPQSQSVAEP